MWDKFTFLNFNGAATEVEEWICNSRHTVVDMWLLIHAGIKGKPC